MLLNAWDRSEAIMLFKKIYIMLFSNYLFFLPIIAPWYLLCYAHKFDEKYYKR